jgi:hypothetical protein
MGRPCLKLLSALAHVLPTVVSVSTTNVAIAIIARISRNSGYFACLFFGRKLTAGGHRARHSSAL